MSESSPDSPTVAVGDAVFNDSGEQLGTIRRVDQAGFRVEFASGVAVHPESRSSLSGEVELVWRCAACGEVGEIKDIPDACPSCGASREDLYYWIED